MKDRKHSRIKVLLLDSHPAVRAGVRACFAGEPIVVVGESSDAEDCLRKAKRLAPDVVILESFLPAIDGGALTRRLRAETGAKVIAYSGQSGRSHVVRMARCGAHGYVMKDAPLYQLVEAVHRVHSGGLSFPADMADAIVAPSDEPRTDEEKSAELTERQREVLVLLADGMANKEVARKLGISIRTAETHREQLTHRLNLMSVASLTKYAIQQGLTSL